MNDNNNEPNMAKDDAVLLTPETPVAAPLKKSGHLRGLIWTAGFILVVIVVVTVGSLMLRPVPQPTTAQKPISDMSAKYAALEDHVRELDKRIDDMTMRMANLTAVAPVAEAFNKSDVNAPSGNIDVQVMKQNLNALSTTVKGLEDDLKMTSLRATAAQKASSASTAASVAYVQLRDAVMSNKPFANELENFRKATPTHADVTRASDNLTKVAATGVASMTSLKDEFVELEHNAHLTIEKSEAQGWMGKLKAKLDTLITVRSTREKAGPDSKMAEVEKALDQGDLKHALDDVKALPADAAAVFKDWQTKAEARLESEKDLHDIGDDLMAPPEKPEPPAEAAPSNTAPNPAAVSQ